MMKQKVIDVAVSLNLTAETFAERKAFIGLTADEEQLLQTVQHRVSLHAGELVEAFYVHLVQFEPVAKLLRDDQMISRLKNTQSEYFYRLLSGVYDYDYALDRLSVGLVHERIGLAPQWYTGAFGCYLTRLAAVLQSEFHHRPEQVASVLLAINKVMLLDVTLTLDAYHHVSQENIVKARDDALTLYRAQTEQIERLAFYDNLTGLPNRNLLGERVEQLLAIAQREARQVALIYMDIINLKEINDALGHEVGDKLLQAVSQKLLETVSDMDAQDGVNGLEASILAHITGDEFALAGLVSSGEDVLVLINHMNTAFAQPFRIAGAEISVRKRYGVVLAPHDGESYEMLLRHADIALNQAKGRADMLCFYDSVLGSRIREKANMARKLEAVLEQNTGLELRFQPQFDLATRELCGAEVLLRWFDSELGWISPSEFIPLAEERGLINAITRRVLKMVGKQRRLWQDQGLFVPDRIQIKLAVNVSAHDLEDERFTADLLDLLKQEGVAPQCFELELTETGLMRDPEDAIRMLHHLKDQGFALAIDDFGTGHSSLNYLREINADLLKIDMSFVQNLDQDEANQVIVKTIIAMAHIFGMKTLAEGIESQAVADELASMGCDYGQGYNFARPMTATEFEQRWLGH